MIEVLVGANESAEMKKIAQGAIERGAVVGNEALDVVLKIEQSFPTSTPVILVGSSIPLCIKWAAEKFAAEGRLVLIDPLRCRLHSRDYGDSPDEWTLSERLSAIQNSLGHLMQTGQVTLFFLTGKS